MIDMILTKPTRLHGIEHAAGDLVSVDPHTAARLLERSCARLVDASDLVVILRHVERHQQGQQMSGAYVTRSR